MTQAIVDTVASRDLLKERAALPWRMNCDGNLEVMLLRPWRAEAGAFSHLCSGARTGIQLAERREGDAALDASGRGGDLFASLVSGAASVRSELPTGSRGRSSA